jgi:hypothetical protein
LDEPELIAWLEEQLGGSVPTDVISLLREDSFLHVEGEAEQQDLLNRTRKLVQLTSVGQHRQADRRSKRTKLASEPALRALAKRDVLRRDAISEYWAKDASRQREVVRFRTEVLGGKLLTSDEAWEFLESPAASMFSVDELVAANVDPVRHSATFTDRDAAASPFPTLVFIEKPVITLEVGGERLSTRVERMIRAGGRWVRTYTSPGSVADLYRRVTEALERHKYPWQAGDAGWFILTGQTPVVAPLGHSINWHVGSHGNRAVINIHVEPSISVERVTALYRDLQSAILGHRYNRPVSERRIALFRFVTEQADDSGEIPPWRTLMPEWNRRHKKWKYENVRNFSRDYWAAARLLLFPEYKII